MIIHNILVYSFRLLKMYVYIYIYVYKISITPQILIGNLLSI